jgi:hypothetical protein
MISWGRIVGSGLEVGSRRKRGGAGSCRFCIAYSVFFYLLVLEVKKHV